MRRKYFLLTTLLFVVPLIASADALFSFATDAQTVAANTVSGAITVQASSAVTQTTCLLVSSNSSTGQFSSSATSWNAVSAVTMSKNSSNRTFYYKDSTEGSYTFTVKVAPKPDSVSSSCTTWSGAAAAVQSTITQAVTIGSGGTQVQSQDQTQTQTATDTSSQTQTQVTTTSGGVGPPLITAQITTDTTTAAGAGTRFVGAAFGATGEPLSGARYVWNFGDGATGEGSSVLHTYEYPGVYDVELSVGYNYSSATARASVAVKAPKVALVLQADDSLVVANMATQDLSIGEWILSSGKNSFRIPPDTLVHAQGGVRFSPAVMGFAASTDAVLSFANGKVAATSTIASDSPLHGEPVALAAPQAPPPAVISAVKAPLKKAPSSAASSNTQPAAATLASPVGDDVQWSYFVGLAAIIALGAVGAYYAQSRPAPAASETEALVDEFEIE